MKIAVAGKGGSGKTTVSGTIARSYAADGYDVLALDDDDDPNLAVALGVPQDEGAPLPNALIKNIETPEGEIPFVLTKSLKEIIKDHGIPGPDEVTLLTAGCVEAGSGCFGISHITLRRILSDIELVREGICIMDMPNGLEHFGLATAKAADVMLVVVEPYYNSLNTAPKARELANEMGIPAVRIVANKVRDNRDREVVEDYCDDHDFELTTVVPFDDAVRRAELDGTAPIDSYSDSPAVRAMCALADDMAQIYGQPPQSP